MISEFWRKKNLFECVNIAVWIYYMKRNGIGFQKNCKLRIKYSPKRIVGRCRVCRKNETNFGCYFCFRCHASFFTWAPVICFSNCICCWRYTELFRIRCWHIFSISSYVFICRPFYHQLIKTQAWFWIQSSIKLFVIQSKNFSLLRVWYVKFSRKLVGRENIWKKCKENQQGDERN